MNYINKDELYKALAEILERCVANPQAKVLDVLFEVSNAVSDCQAVDITKNSEWKPVIEEYFGRPLDEVIDIVNAHTSGRGRILPCGVGDDCYPLPRGSNPLVKRKISRIIFSKKNIIIGYYENNGQYKPPLRTRTLGEDVFLTKEEAEAKLKGGD